MVSLSDIKKISLMASLDDSQLEKIRSPAQLHLFGEKAVLFEEGQVAETLYMMLNGKVLLELNASDTVRISLEAVKPGDSFGWSALMPGSVYTTHAICAEPCELITIHGQELLHFMEKDPLLGYRIMEGMLKILKIRLQERTDQFLKTLRQHPDMEKLFCR